MAMATWRLLGSLTRDVLVEWWGQQLNCGVGWRGKGGQRCRDSMDDVEIQFCYKGKQSNTVADHKRFICTFKTDFAASFYTGEMTRRRNFDDLGIRLLQ